MRALVFDGSLRFHRHYRDPEPDRGEAIVRVALAGICATDLEIVRGYMRFSGVPGHEFVGTVTAGPKLWKDKRVGGEINCACRKCDLWQRGLSNHCRNRTVIGIQGRDGCFADYVAVPVDNLHELPDAVSDEQAVFVEPLAAAYQVVKQCKIEKRMKVAVLGSGRLGLLVAQVLQGTGCKLEVIGRNPLTLSFCEKKGIQVRSVEECVPKAEHDLVVECTGEAAGLNLACRLGRPRGTIVLKSTYAADSRLNLSPVVVHEITLLGSRCGPFAEAINALARRQIDVLSMITKQFPLSRGVEAFAAAAEPQHIKVLLKAEPIPEK